MRRYPAGPVIAVKPTSIIRRAVRPMFQGFSYLSWPTALGTTRAVISDYHVVALASSIAVRGSALTFNTIFAWHFSARRRVFGLPCRSTETSVGFLKSVFPYFFGSVYF